MNPIEAMRIFLLAGGGFLLLVCLLRCAATIAMLTRAHHPGEIKRDDGELMFPAALYLFGESDLQYRRRRAIRQTKSNAAPSRTS